MTSQEPVAVAPTIMTTQEPMTVAPTIMTTQEPETLAPIMMTTHEPENATSAQMTTQEPKTVAQIMMTSQEPDNIAGGGSGYGINPTTGRVVKMGSGDSIPSGYERNPHTGRMVKIGGKAHRTQGQKQVRDLIETQGTPEKRPVFKLPRIPPQSPYKLPFK